MKTKINPDEWNFNNVPDSQLKAACIWEYARESIWNRAECERWAQNPNPVVFGLAEIVVMGLLGEMLFGGYASISDDNGETWRQQVGAASYFPKPWHSLPEPVKAHCIQVCGKLPQPIECPMSTVLAEELSQRAKEVQEKWQKDVERLRPARVIWPITDERISIKDGGVEVMIVSINWPEFRDTEIADFVSKWIQDNRPKEIPEPAERGRGKKPRVDYRNKLRDLGAMRLMHETEVGNMKNHQPDACRLFHDQLHWTERYWYLAHKCARENFHKLLPFISASELPIHAPTKSNETKRRLKVNPP